MLLRTRKASDSPVSLQGRASPFAIREGRYEVRLAETPVEVASALRLRHKVFNVEMGDRADAPGALEFDSYDLQCRHLLVIEQATGRTVGTYRFNTIETAGSPSALYSAGEFTIDRLPPDVLRDGLEIGRACIEKEHRNTKVLFLLWKGLLEFSKTERKRYFFGCCSIFTRDERAGALAYWKLEGAGHLSARYNVRPRRDAIDVAVRPEFAGAVLPALFEMYLRIGAEVCGPPMIDREFGTIDFFVVLDIQRMSEKYRRMFS